jgi:hypothetical protein
LGGRDQKKEEEEGAKGKEHGKEYSKGEGEGEVLEARRWLMADG